MCKTFDLKYVRHPYFCIAQIEYMQHHVKVYLKFFNLNESSWIECEHCRRKAVDIHHIIPRSKFGTKTKSDQDIIENLIALCRVCHNQAHMGLIPKRVLYNIHLRAIIRADISNKQTVIDSLNNIIR
jgi:5-methylcytosine-specific restriction endonuclease McrA